MDEIELQADLLDMLEALARAEAEFVLIGGWALAVHGYGRGTDDLDVLVRPSPENATKVFAALQTFGAPLLQHKVSEQTFAEPGYGYRIGFKPNLIEILTTISGVSFDEVWADKVIIMIGGVEVPVMGRRTLLANKRAAGRAKDLADVEWLERNDSADD
jgi:hypothetical protein